MSAFSANMSIMTVSQTVPTTMGSTTSGDLLNLSSSTMISLMGPKLIFDRMCRDDVCPDPVLLKQVTAQLKVDNDLLQTTLKSANMFIALVRLHPEILQNNTLKQNYDILRECSVFPGSKRFESTVACFEALEVQSIAEGELAYTQYLAAGFFSRHVDMPVITLCKSLAGFEELSNTAEYELLSGLTAEYKRSPNENLLYTICWIAAAPFSGEMKTWRNFMLNSVFEVAATQSAKSDTIISESSLGLEWATFCMNSRLGSPTLW